MRKSVFLIADFVPKFLTIVLIKLFFAVFAMLRGFAL